MSGHDIDLAHGIDLVQSTDIRDVCRDQTARHAAGGV
jgi:hypothetical protein